MLQWFQDICCLLNAAARWSEEEHDHIWAQEVVQPAEGIYNQEVANHAGDADGENDGADGVVGVVGHIHCGKGVRGLGRHRHLKDKTGNDMQMWQK